MLECNLIQFLIYSIILKVDDKTREKDLISEKEFMGLKVVLTRN